MAAHLRSQGEDLLVQASRPAAAAAFSSASTSAAGSAGQRGSPWPGPSCASPPAPKGKVVLLSGGNLASARSLAQR